MPDLSNVPSFLLALLTLLLSIGGFFTLRRGASKQAQEVADRVIAGLTAEVDTLRRRIDDLEKERSTQDNVIKTIRYLLKQYDLKVTIGPGDMVTISDSNGNRKSTRVQQPAPIKPIAQPTDDDETAN